MIKIAQQILIGVYTLARSSGLLNSDIGRRIFTGAYWSYKRLLEPQPIALSQYVLPGFWVVDVGANLGFYSELFAKWVSADGKVLAIEPEQNNFNNLTLVANRAGDGKRIEPLMAIMSETDGELFLRINPTSHADHRVAGDSNGTKVTSYRLDSALNRFGNPRVGLIKIDVQGSEMRVLQGAIETLRQHRPAVYIEIDDKALLEAGTSVEELERFFDGLGYSAWRVEGAKVSGPLAESTKRDMRLKIGYADFLYLPIG